MVKPSKIVERACGFGFTGVLTMASVDPETVTSNLGKWWHLVSDEPPQWLANPLTDLVVQIVSAIGLFLLLSVWLIRFVRRRLRQRRMNRPLSLAKQTPEERKIEKVTAVNTQGTQSAALQSKWSKYNTADLRKIDDALLAMDDLLSVRARTIVKEMFFHLNNFQNLFHHDQQSYVDKFKFLHWELRHINGELSELQFRRNELYGPDLASVYDNLGLSEASGKLVKFLHIIEGSGGPVTGTLYSLVIEKKDEAEEDLKELNRWIVRSKARVVDARREVAALMEGR